jgi:hypothetical protein
MTTNSNIAKRAGMAGTAATQTTALYQGAAVRRVVCPSASALNTAGRLIPGGAFGLEGLRHADRRQLQN